MIVSTISEINTNEEHNCNKKDMKKSLLSMLRNFNSHKKELRSCLNFSKKEIATYCNKQMDSEIENFFYHHYDEILILIKERLTEGSVSKIFAPESCCPECDYALDLIKDLQQMYLQKASILIEQSLSLIETAKNISASTMFELPSDYDQKRSLDFRSYRYDESVFN